MKSEGTNQFLDVVDLRHFQEPTGLLRCAHSSEFRLQRLELSRHGVPNSLRLLFVLCIFAHQLLVFIAELQPLIMNRNWFWGRFRFWIWFGIPPLTLKLIAHVFQTLNLFLEPRDFLVFVVGAYSI